jgi:hypothetical protein
VISVVHLTPSDAGIVLQICIFSLASHGIEHHLQLPCHRHAYQCSLRLPIVGHRGQQRDSFLFGDPLVTFSRRRLLRSTQSFAQTLRIGGTPRGKFFQAIVLLQRQLDEPKKSLVAAALTCKSNSSRKVVLISGYPQDLAPSVVPTLSPSSSCPS